MSSLRPYSQLGSVHRNEPCIEYPGKWLIYSNGMEIAKYLDFQAAYANALNAWELSPEGTKISICWEASDNDPRIGEIWFTGFYQHGRINQFGKYSSFQE